MLLTRPRDQATADIRYSQQICLNPSAIIKQPVLTTAVSSEQVLPQLPTLPLSLLSLGSRCLYPLPPPLTSSAVS